MELNEGSRGAKWISLSSIDLPQLGLVIVSSDHTTIGPTAAFFKESMRRDAMIGTKIEFVLRNKR